jgi:hypothetical protein
MCLSFFCALLILVLRAIMGCALIGLALMGQKYFWRSSGISSNGVRSNEYMSLNWLGFWSAIETIKTSWGYFLRGWGYWQGNENKNKIKIFINIFAKGKWKQEQNKKFHKLICEMSHLQLTCQISRFKGLLS